MKFRLEIENQTHKIEIFKDKFGNLEEIFIDDQKFPLSLLKEIKDIKIVKNNDSIALKTSEESWEIKLTDISAVDSVQSDNSSHIDQMKEFFKAGKLVSPLPGKIVDIRYKEGATVDIGKVILSLEAMKMENEIIAPFKIRIIKLLIAVNESVSDKQILLEYEQL